MDDINDEDFISVKKETETVKCICFALIVKSTRKTPGGNICIRLVWRKRHKTKLTGCVGSIYIYFNQLLRVDSES